MRERAPKDGLPKKISELTGGTTNWAIELPTLEEVEARVRKADAELRRQFIEDRSPHSIHHEAYYSAMMLRSEAT